MERTALETSGNIASVGYDPASQTLEIQFSSGGIYSYAAVPPEVHDKLIHADSPGHYFAVYIRACYEYTHLNPKKPREEANAESGKDSTQEGEDSAAPSAPAATAPRKKVKKGRG